MVKAYWKWNPLRINNTERVKQIYREISLQWLERQNILCHDILTDTTEKLTIISVEQIKYQKQ